MVQSTDNYSNLTGRIVSRSPHPRLAGYDKLIVMVQATGPVDTRPDLLASTIGASVELTVPRALLGDQAQSGAVIRTRARRTPEGAIADREPEPGTFEITRA